jgi:arylsulfatase A-like enzyme
MTSGTSRCWNVHGITVVRWLVGALCLGCGPAPFTVEMPLHLEDHLAAATITGSELPANPPQTVEWRFDQPQPEWKALLPYLDWPPTLIEHTADALRVTLPEGRRDGNGSLHGGIYIDLPDWRPGEWAHVLVRARTTGSVHSMLLGLNPREQPVPSNATQATFQLNGGITPIVRDGSVQTYLIRPNWGSAGARGGPWRRVGLGFFAPKPDSIDILSVSVVPSAAEYAGVAHGVRPITWTFETEEQAWRPVTTTVGSWSAAPEIRWEQGVLRVGVGPRNHIAAPDATAAYLYAPVQDLDRADWGALVVRARAEGSLRTLRVFLNVRDNAPPTDPLRLRADSVQRGEPWWPYAVFLGVSESVRLVADGSVQTYRIPLTLNAPHPHAVPWQGAIREIGLNVSNDGEDETEGRMEILSVSLVPKGAEYAGAAHGARSVLIGDRIRRTLYTHAPARVSYRVRVPEGGRLDAGLGVLKDDSPVTFRVTVGSGEREVVLFEERYADPERWAQRSVDLSAFARQSVTLSLDAQAEQPGTVAFWGAPTVSGARTSDKPNVIFYVIDGGAADQMSLYGYNRPTTPNLERLAADGAVFEHAYSNSSWSKPSTTGFMTSLHSSVLGNVGGRFEPLPPEARTMAERFHEAGYQTAVFTSNPWAGSASSLERGVDMFRDRGVDPPSGSSVELHRDFRDWRAASPGEPYWVHFQTTDVHNDHVPLAPFAGLFAPPGAVDRIERWNTVLDDWRRRNTARITADPGEREERWAETGIDRIHYWNAWRSIYDETLAHQDYQLGRFVERLKETGEWDHTLLVIAADHSIWAGSDEFLVPLQDSPPPAWQEPILRSSISRVPLMFIWPGHIAGGQRFSQPVSMIDILPTVLELAGLPAPEALQGQSLAPLLLSQPEWEPRPVIFEEFEKDPRTGDLRGRLEMIDGRWGASLWIGPPEDSLNHRPTPLLLFDVWNDPLALTLMNEAHPELVQKYTALLEQQWEAHRLLARRFTPGGQVELTPAQLETLRALGYIR